MWFGMERNMFLIKTLNDIWTAKSVDDVDNFGYKRKGSSHGGKYNNLMYQQEQYIQV